MNEPAQREEPVVFDCQGEQLIGVVHHGEAGAEVGMLCIVAGGPQYRGGCGRQLVELARRAAAEGFPVMRFDHRGLGDGGGEFLGFEYMEDDLCAAVEQFILRVPSLERVVLWGGCDAASAALINAGVHPAIDSIVAANPWVSTSETAAKVRQKHYLQRLGEWSFWKKVITLQYNPLDYLKSSQRKSVATSDGSGSTRKEGASLARPVRQDYVQRMLNGFTAFDGDVLFLMSGRSLISREFDELVHSSERWRSAFDRKSIQRQVIEDADQTFSSRQAKSAMIVAGMDWLKSVAGKADPVCLSKKSR